MRPVRLEQPYAALFAAGVLVGAVLSGWHPDGRAGRVTAAVGEAAVGEAAVGEAAAAQFRAVGLPEPPPGAYVVLPRDALRAIDQPQFVAVEWAKVAPDAPMVLVRGKSEERAYSLRLLNQHEIANDLMDAVPITVTW